MKQARLRQTSAPEEMAVDISRSRELVPADLGEMPFLLE
jgi:hypothetical protein